MKKILGLDLGTSSIGWAMVNESENENEKSSIIKLGVRVNPLTVDELGNFEKGKSITTAADRTLKRSARRNLQRFKLRRADLKELLIENNIISTADKLSEDSNTERFATYRQRAKAATEEISLLDFAKVLLMINSKRGYKSSRKAKTTDEGEIIDGMAVALEMHENNQTPGQFAYDILRQGKNHLPDFYTSDLLSEFDLVWSIQQQFYPCLLTTELRESLRGRNKNQTWAILKSPLGLVGAKRETKGFELKKENYKWRSAATTEQLGLEELAVVLSEINGQVANASGYLGAIGDRSKELYFTKRTVGQYLWDFIQQNPNKSIKNKVFYRQDYADEFEKVWDCQASFHKELTTSLKDEVRKCIFFQRPLKSQKSLISYCEFECKTIVVEKNGVKKEVVTGQRVCPKSSPIFQDFKILQILNNLVVSDKESKQKWYLESDEKQKLFEELSYKPSLSKSDILKILYGSNGKMYDLNFKSVDGNRTQYALFKAYQTIIDMSGHGEYDFEKMPVKDVVELVSRIFTGLGINTDILYFDSSDNNYEQQPMFQLWHLLYSFEGDNSNTGKEKLISIISNRYGFEREYASVIANIVFNPDYSSLSTKAIRKILPYMKDGLEYSVACEYAGYRHSKNSLTKEEIQNKVLKDKLDAIKHNSLRNPVVEKILNQMVNVVNQAIETYGKPDEIRIELARELKKSAEERDEMTRSIAATAKLHEEYKNLLQKEFGIANPSRNDIIRYKLYLELESNGYKTLYSNTYIPREKIFSKDFDIEHIIPQAKLFDDSFSNKTLESRSVNLAKSNATAYDYVATSGESNLSEYISRVESLFKGGKISRTKYKNLLMKESEIPSGFINRELGDSQYVAKKAREILESIVRYVVPTTGSITDRLREDWQLVDVMKELNWKKYDKLGLTEIYTDKDGRKIGRIKNWTKRNDHRHHAMDALTIAFTKRSFIQYLNNLNARTGKTGESKFVDLDNIELSSVPTDHRSSIIYAIEAKELYRDNGKLKFRPPMPLDEFRATAKRELENTLVSIKAKNKVATRNANITKSSHGRNKVVQLTPRGQLHLETIYGKIDQYVTKEEKVGSSFNAEKIQLVASKKYREALLKRLEEYNGDAKKAFTGSHSLAKDPVYLNDDHTAVVPEKVKIVTMEATYTIRKPISPDLKIEKVVDAGVRRILQERLNEFGGDAKKAFSNLEENPIYLDKDKGISIKRVKIYGINNAIALHYKKDHNGEYILDEEGQRMPVDFVNTGNNHHVAVYVDEDGVIHDEVVSFYEAMERTNQGLPVINKSFNADLGWKFLFTMKQNEYFVFPNEETGFNPSEIDLMDASNYSLISPNLFRVQKLSESNYVFRHHLETNVDMDYKMKGVTWTDFRSTKGLDKIVKVRVNHLGQIVSVGEY